MKGAAADDIAGLSSREAVTFPEESSSWALASCMNCHPDRSEATWRGPAVDSSSIRCKWKRPFPYHPEQLTCRQQVESEMNGDRLALSQQIIKGAPYLARFSRDVGYREP